MNFIFSVCIVLLVFSFVESRRSPEDIEAWVENKFASSLDARNDQAKYQSVYSWWKKMKDNVNLLKEKGLHTEAESHMIEIGADEVKENCLRVLVETEDQDILKELRNTCKTKIVYHKIPLIGVGIVTESADTSMDRSPSQIEDWVINIRATDLDTRNDEAKYESVYSWWKFNTDELEFLSRKRLLTAAENVKIRLYIMSAKEVFKTCRSVLLVKEDSKERLLLREECKNQIVNRSQRIPIVGVGHWDIYWDDY